MANKTRLKHMGRRGLSFFLALVMCISLVQITAFAGNETHSSAEQIKPAETAGKYLYATFDENGNQLSAESDSATKVTSDGVELTKRIEGTANENEFKITLEVKTKEKLTEFTDIGGANVVLVFDVSTSMDHTTDGEEPEDFGWKLENTRWTALKEAASSFIDSLMPEGNTKNQVSIVAYGGSNEYYVGIYYPGPNWVVLQDWTSSGETAKASYNSYDVVCQDNVNKSGVTNRTSLRQAKFNDDGTKYGATNCQAGFIGAKSQMDALKNSNEAAYRENGNYVIFMSDGAANRSYKDSGKISNQDAANRAQTAAANLKNAHSDLTLYTIGFGTEKLNNNEIETARKVLWDQTTAQNNRKDSDYNPAVDQFFSANMSDQLKIVFENIVKRIQVATEAWTVTDPLSQWMNKDQEAVGIEADAAYGYDSAAGEIKWDLRKDFTFKTSTETKTDGNTTVKTTYYIYTRSYTVKLDNIKCAPNTYYLTNGATELVYALHDSNGELDTEVRHAYFNVPQVKSLFANLAFDKVAYHDASEKLKAAFTLTHDSDCPCGVESSKSYTSEYKNSKVTFENIPSGHKYALEEGTAPTGYVKLDKTYPVTVAWGQLTVGGTDEMFDGSAFKNKADPQKKDLVITKNWLPTGAEAPVRELAVTVTGSVDGVAKLEYTYPVTLTDSGWKKTISVPTVDQATGKPITYAVEEEPNGAYKLISNSGVSTDNRKLVVTLENQITDTKTITIKKDWGDQPTENRTSVTVGLFVNGTWKEDITLNSGNSWSVEKTVDNYSRDQKLTYTVQEKDKNEVYHDSGEVMLGNDKSYLVTVNQNGNVYTVTNMPKQAYTESVSGTKTWVDGDGTSGTRPVVTMNLKVGNIVVDSQTLEGTSYSWSNLPVYALEDTSESAHKVIKALMAAGYSMNGAKLEYIVEESFTSDEYTSSENTDSTTGAVTGFTNTIKDIDETADIKVTKVWKDEQNAEDTRPASVKLILHRSVTKNGTTVLDTAFENKNVYYEFKQVAGSGQRTEQYTFQDLDVYDADGFKYTYTVTEDGVNDTDRILAGKGGVKYGVSYDQESLTVTNALGESSDTVKVRVTKLWKDDANADGTRPDSIRITVAGKTVTLDGTVDESGEIEAWVAEFDLPRFDSDGKKITYTASDVTEVKSDKYQTGKVEAAEVPGYSFAFVVTNELKQKYFDITVEKTWNTETGIEWEGFPKDAAHPDSVKVVLSGDGKTYPLTLDATNQWKNTQENLPRYDKDGKVISYAVKEVSVSGYQPSGTEKANWKLDEATGNYTISIENTFIQERTSVSGQKYWKDGDSTSNRPASIQVGLLANCTLVETKTVTANDGWQYAFKDLPLYSGWPFSPSTVIKYTVRELNGETPVAPNGTITYESPADGEDYTYTVTYAGSNIFNTRSTDTVEFAVNKVWIGPASSDVAFGLYQNGTLVDTVSGEDMYTPLNSEHVWVGVFAEQPKYDANGDVYEYAVKELGDDGAAAEITENGQTITIGSKEYTVSGEKLGTTYVITNKVEQEYTTIDGEKKWEGVPGSVDLPRSIQVGLYGENGQLVDLDGQENPVAVRADSDGKWTFSFQNVSVYALDNDGDGHTIRYTVKEVGADSGSIRHGDDYYTVTSGTEDNDYTVTNTYRRSDEYKYFVVVNYVTHKQDGTDSVDGEHIYQQTTEVKKNDTAKVTPPATLTHDGHEFTYDADNEGNLTEKEITAPGTYKLILWYERTEETSPKPDPDPKPDPGSDDVDISVKKVWNDDDSDLRPDSISVQLYRNGKAYGDEVTLSENNNWRYTWSGLKDGYTWTVEEVDVPDGYVSEASRVGNRWIITNTLEGTEIKDPETPATDLPDTDVPTSGDTGVDLPEPEVPRADAPKTGDAAGLWAMAAAVSGMGLVWLAISGKKRKEEDA